MKKQFLLVIVLLLGLFTVGASAQNDNIFNVSMSNDPRSLDPQGMSGPTTNRVMFSIYDTLLYRDNNAELQPNLAETFTISDDGLSLTFELKEGILFSDGSPLNAETVKFSFERFQQVGQRAISYPIIMEIASIDVVDEYTVTFNLHQVAGELLSTLAEPYTGILSPTAVEAAGEEYFRNPVGTGPYMLEEWVPDSHIIMVPNPNYNGHRVWEEGTHSIDAYRIDFIRDQSSIANALEAGQLDFAQITSPDQLARFQDNPNFVVHTFEQRGLIYMGFNTTSDAFSSVDARVGVAQAVDVDLILTFLGADPSLRAYAPLAANLPGYDPVLEESAIQFDAAAALAAIEANGLSGQTVVMMTSVGGVAQLAGTVVQQQLAQVGITVQIDAVDFGTMMRRRQVGDYDLFISAYYGQDPDLLNSAMGTGGFANMGFYSNEEVDALLIEGRAYYDIADRMPFYTEAQQIAMQDAIMVPFMQPEGTYVYSTNVEGLSFLDLYPIFSNITLQ